jgi:uncharacterized protein
MIRTQLSEDIKNAMRAKDQKTLSALRLISAAFKQVEVDERIEIDDARALIILDKMLKQRRESIQQFQNAGRHELVEQEEFELEKIQHYLPEPLSEKEINDMIDESIQKNNAQKISDMGKVMNDLKSVMQGRADMSKVSQIIKDKLQNLNS